MRTDLNTVARQAAHWIAEADGLVIATGAGMGVDSGQPDFRGNEGFWKAYPALRQAGMSFKSVASPETFQRNPALAWGFYGHRLALYRRTVPHLGFQLLQDIGANLPAGAFVFTSNVDGQFQKAGYPSDRIVEVHGSIHRLQCQDWCVPDIWSAGAFTPDIDAGRCLLINEPPRCPHCAGIARPNILMFGDWRWIDQRTRQQQFAYNRWQHATPNIVMLEIGAGTDVTTVRQFTASSGRRFVRINPQHEPLLPRQALHMRSGALAGIQAIYAALVERGFIAAEAIEIVAPEAPPDDVRGACMLTPDPCGKV